jgi:ATP-dependent helicase HrpB
LESVVARRRRRLGALVLKDEPLPDPPAGAVLQAMLQGIAELGLAALPWSREAETLAARVRFLRRIEGEAAGWPDFSEAALLEGLEEWLGPYLGGLSRRAQLAGIDLAAALRARLDWTQLQRLDAAAPTHVEVPSGSRVAIDYSGDEPVLAVKLQEMFGAEDTPRVAGGNVPLLVHLLSPAGRPLQVTRDLAGFWRGGYAAVRAEMRGRYPKHPWPDDPLTAPATRRTKARMGG